MAMRKIRKCFTVNQNRTTEEFNEYDKLIKKGLFQAIEIFYPYEKTEEVRNTYTKNVFKLMENDIEVVLHLPHGYYSDLLHEEEYDVILQRFLDGIDYSKQFGVKKLTLHLGAVVRDGKKQNRDNAIKKSIETLKILCDHAYPANIMIENMPRDNELGYSPKEIKYMIEQVNKPNLKFILDFGHAHVSSYPIKEFIEELKPYLYHLHISDNNGMRDEHKPIGEGNINYKEVFSWLDFYEGLYCLEIIYKDHNDLINYEDKFMKLF